MRFQIGGLASAQRRRLWSSAVGFHEMVDDLLRLDLGEDAVSEVALEIDVEERGDAAERHGRAVGLLDRGEIAEIGPLHGFARGLGPTNEVQPQASPMRASQTVAGAAQSSARWSRFPQADADRTVLRRFRLSATQAHCRSRRPDARCGRCESPRRGEGPPASARRISRDAFSGRSGHWRIAARRRAHSRGASGAVTFPPGKAGREGRARSESSARARLLAPRTRKPTAVGGGGPHPIRPLRGHLPQQKLGKERGHRQVNRERQIVAPPAVPEERERREQDRTRSPNRLAVPAPLRIPPLRSWRAFPPPPVEEADRGYRAPNVAPRAPQTLMNALTAGSAERASRSAALGSCGRSRALATTQKKPSGSSPVARN